MPPPLSPAHIQALATRLLHDQRAIWADHPPWREIDPRHAPRRKPGWYATQRTAWEAQDLRHLGTSYKPIHPPGQRDCRSSVDVYLDASGTVIGACFEIRPWWWRRLLVPRVQVSECISVWDDGRELNTSNATDVRGSEVMPELERVLLARDTPIARILARHRQRLTEITEHPRCFKDLAEINAAMESKDQRNVAHLEQIGWITRSALIHQGAVPADADALVAEVQRLLADERLQVHPDRAGPQGDRSKSQPAQRATRNPEP